MMKQYKVKYKQNIFDVAMNLYGSIEGVFELLALNPDLSYESDLNAGDEITWEPQSVIYPSIVDTFDKDRYYPANGERHVYYKTSSLPLSIQINIADSSDHISLGISGTGNIQIDWGDNTDLENVELGEFKTVEHFFDCVMVNGTVRIYGDCTLSCLDLKFVKGKVHLIRPIQIDKILARKNNMVLHGLFLSDGVPTVTFVDTPSDSIDDFLIYAATHPEIQHAFKVTSCVDPGGEYKEPEKDSNGKYIIRTGMEAVYVITNNAEYNRPDIWVINIKNTVYSYDKSQAGWILPVYLY